MKRVRAAATIGARQPVSAYAYVTGRFPHPRAIGPATAMVTRPSLRRRSIRTPPASRGRYSSAAICSTTATTGKPTRCGKACGTRAAARPGGRLPERFDQASRRRRQSAEARSAGVRAHAARAAELFTQVRGEIGRPECLGFDLDALVATANELAHHPVVAASDAPVEIVFGFQLIPRVRGASARIDAKSGRRQPSQRLEALELACDHLQAVLPESRVW